MQRTFAKHGAIHKGFRLLTPPPSAQAMPVSKQHYTLSPSILALWMLAVRFAIGPIVCHVCCLVLWIWGARCLYFVSQKSIW